MSEQDKSSVLSEFSGVAALERAIKKLEAARACLEYDMKKNDGPETRRALAEADLILQDLTKLKEDWKRIIMPH